MKHFYYILSPDFSGDERITEEQYLALFGDETRRPYATAVYKGEMALEAVPEEYREAVAAIVANRTARWGDYADWPVRGSGKLTDILLGEEMQMKRKDAKAYRAAIEAGSNAVERTDAEALKVKGIYPAWESLIGYTAEKAEFKFTYNGDLYKTIPENHAFSAEWVPGVGTESIYTRIDEAHTGNYDDPIPYEGNMELFEGLYYSQGGVVYLCTRSTGQPVYHDLSALVGIYVEVAT